MKAFRKLCSVQRLLEILIPADMKTILRSTHILILTCIAVKLLFCSATQSGIRVEGNGYVGVTVTISGNVQEDNSLIENITRAFIAGSTFLYSSTNKKLFFKSIDIIIPKEWNPKETYININGNQFESAPIRIDVPNPSKGNTPYVRGLSGCGGRGRYMHLTPELLSRQRTGYGPIDHVIVHEWGHLRFGVYDEYPTIPDSRNTNYRQKFYNDGGTWKPVRCTEEIKGFRSKSCKDESQTCSYDATGRPELECQFCIKSALTTAKASLMGNQWLPSLTDFCDSDESTTLLHQRHNSKSVNKQNHFCNGKSVWEVLRDHPDIKGLKSGSDQQNTEPVFRLLREEENVVSVLVLDTSGSMSGEPLRKLIEVAKWFLHNTVTNGTWVGVVKFNSGASVTRSLTQVVSSETRQYLVNGLPTSASGSTSIGAGLKKGCEMIVGHTSSTKGTQLLLVTDGRENRAPYIADVETDIVSKGIKITTLAYGQNADSSLESLARASGGQSFLYAGQVNSSGLFEAFNSLVPSSESQIQVASENIKISENITFEKKFQIDKTSGRGLQIYLLFGSSIVGQIIMKIQTPLGTTFSVIQSALDGSATFNNDGDFKAGTYMLQITADSKSEITGQLLINTKRRTSSNSISSIDIEGWLSDTVFYIPQMQFISLYVSVQKGYAPVVHAEITAIVEDAYGNSFHLSLQDNGVGSDIEERDGIYSANILSNQVGSEGRYSLKVMAQTVEGKSKILLRDELLSDGYEIVLKEGDVEIFQREKVVDQFVVHGTFGNTTDSFPPARITTLSIQKYSFENQSFTLTWKATGDDYEYGRASSYDIRMSNDSETLRKAPEKVIQLAMPTSPKLAGEIEIFELKPNSTAENETFYIGIRAVDENNNYGDMSNVISVSVITDPQWLPSADDTPNRTFPLIFAIIIGVAIFMVLLSFGICCIVPAFRKQNRNAKQPKERKSYDNPSFLP